MKSMSRNLGESKSNMLEASGIFKVCLTRKTKSFIGVKEQH